MGQLTEAFRERAEILNARDTALDGAREVLKSIAGDIEPLNSAFISANIPVHVSLVDSDFHNAEAPSVSLKADFLARDGQGAHGRPPKSWKISARLTEAKARWDINYSWTDRPDGSPCGTGRDPAAVVRDVVGAMEDAAGGFSDRQALQIFRHANGGKMTP